MFIKQLSITTGFTKQTPWKTSWNLMEIPQTSPRALSWAATAGYKFHHCQVLLITSNKLFGGEQSLAHRLFSFAWKQEVCLGSSDTLEFGLKLPACLIALHSFLMAANISSLCFSMPEQVNLYGSLKELRSQLKMRRPLSPPRQKPHIMWGHKNQISLCRCFSHTKLIWLLSCQPFKIC